MIVFDKQMIILVDMYYRIHSIFFLIKKYLLLSLFILLTSKLVGVNVEKPDCTFFTIKDGLSGNSITDICQDSRGYIWVGTNDGLNRYNGRQFTKFRNNKNIKRSISGNFIRCISEDLNGNIWVGTLNNGLNMWNRKKGSFQRFNSYVNFDKYIPENNIYGLCNQSDSIIWFKTDNYLVSLNTTTKNIESYDIPSNNLFSSSKLKSSLHFHNNSNIWIGSPGGLLRFDLTSESFLNERIPIVDNEDFDFSTATFFKELKDKSFIIATGNGLHHLKFADNGESYSYKIKTPEGPKSIVNAIIQRSNDDVWVGTNSGLYLLDYDHDKYSYSYNSNPYVTNEICSGLEVTSVIEDNSGLLWVGTTRNGLIKVDFKQRKFKSLCEKSDGLKKLSNYDIKSIYSDRDGLLWLGTGGKGITTINLLSGEFNNIAVDKALNEVNKDVVLAIYEDSLGNIWLGTEVGVFIYSRKSNSIIDFLSTNDKKLLSLLKDNQVNDILEDSNGAIWFATQFGLYKYENEHIYNYFSDRIGQSNLCSDEIIDLYEDDNKILWLGTSQGINYIDINNTDDMSRFNRIVPSNINANELDNTYVLSIIEDKYDNIWFGTSSGLLKYNKSDSTVVSFFEQDGLSNDFIKAMEFDKNDNLWLTTNKGISRLDAKGKILNFDTSEGLPGYIFNKGAIVTGEDGTIYFGGMNGLCYVQPDSLRFNKHEPIVRVGSVNVYHKGRRVEKYHNIDEEISIKYRRGSILSIQLAALEFTNPTKNKFQVFLEGFDEDWRPITDKREINISNIPPGKYRLLVRGSNNDLVWSKEPTELSITVISPIWLTSYAYAFYLIAFVFLIQIVINYRLRKYKRAYKALENRTVGKENVEAQKEVLSQMNQHLTDSIHYAKRIQESILPSRKEFLSSLKDSFVYYRPKDVVSGDFYWLHNENDLIYVASVDCTGHGVPGAFLSIIANNMLRNIVNVYPDSTPDQILNILNKEVNNTFKKHSQSDDMQVNDGMDIALCVINKSKKQITFAGAISPLYLVREDEIITYKGDRIPIGHPEEIGIAYTCHQIDLKEKDVIYLFSDGYADQFGGEEGKKFKYRRFRHLLLTIYGLPFDDQKAILHKQFEDWMGDVEQVDDILVMGIRPLA